MSFSFIHIADIHLGRPFSDISVIGGKEEICADAAKKSFEKIINLAIEKQVDFILISGDSFDSDEHDLGTKLTFIRNLKKLADNGIKSYVICGNHDPICMYKKYESYFRFDEKYNGLINITGITTEDFKACFEPTDGVKLHTVSFKKEESENLSAYLSPADDNNFHIGLIHCDLDKTDSVYSPVSREDLRKLGYDYYALGHIHVPEEKENNMIYAGTHQGRTRKETGEHGCYYVKINNKNDITKEFIPTDSVRFIRLETDCSDCKNKDEIFQKISGIISSEPKENLYEIELCGITEAYKELNNSDNILADFTENYEGNVYKITDKTIPDTDGNIIAEDEGVLGILAECTSENSDINISEIYEQISELHKNIYQKSGLDYESKEFLIKALEKEKNEIISNAKNEIKLLCKEIAEG